MDDIHERLQQARVEAGYETASSAAAAMGVKPVTYTHHENGTRGFGCETAARYAAFFRVTLDWLISNKGPMRGGQAGQTIEPVSARIQDALRGALEVVFVWLRVPDHAQ